MDNRAPVKKEAPLKKIKDALFQRKVKLEQEISAAYSEKFSDDQVQDTGDQALSSTMDNLRNSLQDSKLDEYARIVKALSMIDQGTYGVCTDCQLPISDRRLQSYPDATRCLSCQEAFEEQQSA